MTMPIGDSVAQIGKTGALDMPRCAACSRFLDDPKANLASIDRCEACKGDFCNECMVPHQQWSHGSPKGAALQKRQDEGEEEGIAVYKAVQADSEDEARQKGMDQASKVGFGDIEVHHVENSHGDFWNVFMRAKTKEKVSSKIAAEGEWDTWMGDVLPGEPLCGDCGHPAGIHGDSDSDMCKGGGGDDPYPYDPFDYSGDYRECPKCEGKGSDCDQCKGSGLLPEGVDLDDGRCGCVTFSGREDRDWAEAREKAKPEDFLSTYEESDDYDWNDPDVEGRFPKIVDTPWPMPHMRKGASVVTSQDGGGDAGGDGGGAPDTGAGGEALAVGPEGSGTWKSGPDEDLSGSYTCPDCGDRCYSFSAANSTYWNCAHCGWSSYPRKKKDPNDKTAARGYRCYLCGIEIPPGSYNYFDASGTPTHLVCPEDQDQDMCYDCEGDGRLNGERCPSCKGSGISGNPGGESLEKAMDKKFEQRRRELGMQAAAEDFPGAGKEWSGNPFGPAEERDGEEKPCVYDDGNPALTTFLNKDVCVDHLQYALQDAPSKLEKAQEGVANSTSVQRLQYENAVQQIKKDVDRAHKTLEEYQRKQELSKDSSKTQEKDMYRCQKCGVQATYEAVTKAGSRRLLCAEHAASFKVANDVVGIASKVFPLVDGALLHGSPKKAQYIDLTNEGPKCECGHPVSGQYGHKPNGDCSADECPCQVVRKAASKLPEWITDSGLVEVEEPIEKEAAKACRGCEGDGMCSCGGLGCADCEGTGICSICGGAGYEEAPQDEWEPDPFFAHTASVDHGEDRCPGCGTEADGTMRRLAATAAEEEEPEEEHVHTPTEGSNEPEGEEGAPPNKWAELEARHPWARVKQCPGCGQGHVECAHPFHGETPPTFSLPKDPGEVWDPQEAKFKEPSLEGGFIPDDIEAPPGGMEVLPKGKKKLRELEQKGLKYHQRVKEVGAPDTTSRTFKHDTREEAEAAHQRALDAGFDSTLMPVNTAQVINLNDKPQEPITQLKGKCVHCGKDVFMGDAISFEEKLGPGKFSCSNDASTVASNLEHYKAASVIAQNIGCPNCEGTGSTPDGKVCSACFGTGHGGGLMLKGGSIDADEYFQHLRDEAINLEDWPREGIATPHKFATNPNGTFGCRICGLHEQDHWRPIQGKLASDGTLRAPDNGMIGILYGDDGSTYRSTDGGETWEFVGKVADTESSLDRRDQWHSIEDDIRRELDEDARTAATEHTPAEDEEDEDIKLFKFDHGPGQGNQVVHSEVHQQEHVAHKKEAGTPGDYQLHENGHLFSLYRTHPGSQSSLCRKFRQNIDDWPNGTNWMSVSVPEYGEDLRQYALDYGITPCKACFKAAEYDLDEPKPTYSGPEDEDAWCEACDLPKDEHGPNGECPTWRRRESSIRKEAPGGGEHAPYYIEESGGKYYVVNRKGERKNEEGYFSRGEARKLQKALYKNVPGASEEAEKRHGEPKPKMKAAWKSVLAVEMTGRGCGRCGSPDHTSEACPSNRGHNMIPNTDDRYVSYEDFQPKEGAIDRELMADYFAMSDWELGVDPFAVEAAPKKKPSKSRKKKDESDESEPKKKTKKVKEVGQKVEKGVDKASDAAKWALTGANNPGAGPAGTSVHDLVDNVGTGEHSVPVTFITDHKGEVLQGAEPATCRTCGEPMADHAQWNPTHQVGSPPKSASADWEEIGWMDVPPVDNRPKRGED